MTSEKEKGERCLHEGKKTRKPDPVRSQAFGSGAHASDNDLVCKRVVCIGMGNFKGSAFVMSA